MNEPSPADHFNHAVDQLLGVTTETSSKAIPIEDSQAMTIAHLLAKTDLSAESRIRHTLRRQLLNQIDAQQTSQQHKEPNMKASLWNTPRVLRNRLLIAVGAMFLLLATLMFVYPGGPTAAAQGVENGVKIIVLGAYSTAEKISAQVTGRPLPDDEWNVSIFPGYGIGGNGLPGTHPTVQSVPDLAQAQKLVAFSIKTPGYLPAGYTLREIKLAPVLTGPGALLASNNPNVILFYGGPGPGIAIIQQPVGPQTTSEENVTIGRVTNFATNGELDEVTVAGHKAAWAENILMWEDHNVSYTVGGSNLSLAEATRIAQSLK